MGEAGRAIFKRLWDGIKSVWDGIKSWVDEKVTWLKDKLTFWDNGTAQMNEGTGAGFSHAAGFAYVPYDNYNLCNKLIDIGKGTIVDANIDLYKANGRLTDEEYTALMERLHPSGLETTAE